MRKFVTMGLLFLFTIFMSVVAWFYGYKPAIEGVAAFATSGKTARSVRIPLGGLTYIDIEIDGVNTDVEATNQLTVWQFNDCKIVRTREHLDGSSLGSGVMYMSNREVYKRYGDYYLSISSDKRLLRDTKESLKVSQPFEASCPTMDKTNAISELPNVELPVDYVEDGSWKLPSDVKEILLSKSSEDKSYYKAGWYFNYNFRYQKQTDAVTDAATRVCALSGQDLDWWYLNGDVFIAKAGNEYACIKQRNYTSCYYISSNDLSYILLNL